MRLFPADWRGFLEDLQTWGELSIAARRTFLDGARPGLSLLPAAGDPAVQELKDAGLLEEGSSAGYLTVAAEAAPLHAVLKSLEKYPLFESPGLAALCGYLADHYSPRERSLLHESLALLPNDLPRVAGFVSSVEWLGSALERAGSPRDGDGLAAARALLTFFRDRRERVAVRDLQEYFPDTPEEELGDGIRIGIQRAVFFLCLRRGDLEPVIGIWPAAARRLRRMAVVLAPEPHAAARRFLHPFLIEDMTSVLLAARVEPVPLRRGDDKPFARFVEETSAALLSLPDWMESFTGLGMEGRISLALQALRLGGLLAPEAPPRGTARQAFLLVPAPASEEWLSLSLDQRLERFLGVFSGDGGPLKLFDLLEDDWTSAEGAREQILPWVIQAFASVPVGSFINFADFAEYQAAMGSPLAVASEESAQGPAARAGTPRAAAVHAAAPPAAPTEEALEELWKSFLGIFLGRCLMSVGGAEAGATAEGNPCFRLTPAGRRLLGIAAEAIDAAAPPSADSGDGQGVIVQPNFEIVFLSPSPGAEAELGRFCERVGREVGVLFRLTKQSILRAAAAGLGEDRVLAPLKERARGGIPSNVEQEIRGWLEGSTA